MRILFLTSEFPYPPFGGAPLRNYGLLNGLREHELWLLSFTSNIALDPEQTPLQDICQTIATLPAPVRSKRERIRNMLLTTQADIQGRFWSKAFADQLAQWLKSTTFDIIQIENIEMATYLPIIKQHQPQVRVIYDAHNAEYALQERIYQTERRSLTQLPGAVYSFVQARRVKQFETSICKQVDYVVAVSDTDADLLRNIAGTTPVSMVSNGISTDLYTEPSAKDVDLEVIALVFTGKMDYRPNVDAALWFAQEILPIVRQQLPTAHFYIVGQSPHPRLDVLSGQPGITVTGLVPKVLPYLQAASVFVVPLRMGSGTRLKVLEAMAAGRPIVSTRIGAQGVTATDGHELLLADTAKEFALAIVKLHNDPTQAEAISAQAQTFVRAHYDWSVLLPNLTRIYKELTGE